MSAAIQSFQLSEPKVVRDLIRIKYLNIEYTAFLITSYVVNDEDVSVKVDEHIEVLIDNSWFNLQLIDVEILSMVTTNGNTTYEGDVSIVYNSRVRFATTSNGDTIYGNITTNDDDSIRVDWFNMDGSPYTGDVTTITIIAEDSSTTVQVFQRYVQVNTETNTWLTFLEVLVFNVDGNLIYTHYVSFGGQSITIDNRFTIVEAPFSVQINDVYQVISDNDTNIEIDWDSSQYFSDNDVIGVTLNIRNTVRMVNNVKIRSSAELILNSTTEILNLIGIKTYVDAAPVGRRCGTKPKVKLRNGATLTANVLKEKAPQVVREPQVMNQSSTQN